MRVLARSLGGKLILAAAAIFLIGVLFFSTLSLAMLRYLLAHQVPIERIALALTSLGIFTCTLGITIYACILYSTFLRPLHRLEAQVNAVAASGQKPAGEDIPELRNHQSEIIGLTEAFQHLMHALSLQDEESQHLTKQLGDLVNMSDALISTLNLEQLLREIVSRLGVIMNVKQITLQLYGRGAYTPWAVALWNPQTPSDTMAANGRVAGQKGNAAVYLDPLGDITMTATTKLAAIPRSGTVISNSARSTLRSPRLTSTQATAAPHSQIPREALRELDLLLARMTMRKQKIAYGEDVAAISKEGQEQWTRLALATGQRAVIAIPLLLQEEAIGAVMLYNDEPYQVTERAKFLLSTAAIQAAMAIQDALLFAEVKEKNTALERVNHLKSQFLATVTHELRTPLHSIISYGSLLVDGFVEGSLTAEQEEHIQFMIHRAEDLSQLVDDMLDLSKIEADRMEVNIEPFVLESCLAEVVSQLRPMANNKGLSFGLEVSRPLPLVLADSHRLRQIMLNLVSNALKFTEQGGVTIRCTLLERYDMLRIAVHDTGIGISPAVLEYIFEAFRQADGGTTRKFGGTGLGLAIAKHLVELQGGEMMVESAPGRGSVFSLILPIAPVKAQS